MPILHIFSFFSCLTKTWRSLRSWLIDWLLSFFYVVFFFIFSTERIHILWHTCVWWWCAKVSHGTYGIVLSFLFWCCCCFRNIFKIFVRFVSLEKGHIHILMQLTCKLHIFEEFQSGFVYCFNCYLTEKISRVLTHFPCLFKKNPLLCLKK